MQAVTITQIAPQELGTLIENSIRKIFSEYPQKKIESDQWFNITQLCEYLPDKPKRSTVYGWVHSKKIPFHKKSKALIFLKSEICLWLKEGLHKTAAELEKDVNAETDKFLTSKKRRPC